MKRHLFLIILFLLSSTSVLATIDQKDFSFSGAIDEEGNFTLNITKVFPKNMSLSEIFKNLYLNETTQKLVDSNVQSITMSKRLNKYLYSSGKTSYKSMTKASRSGVTATIINDCSLTRFYKTIKNECKITSAKAPVVGDLFYYGNSSITCRELSDNSKGCHITIKGRPESVNILFMMKRSSERLAVSGVSSTLRSMFKGYYLLVNHHSIVAAQQQLHYRENIAPLWKDLIYYLENEQDLDGTLYFNSTNNGIKVYKI